MPGVRRSDDAKLLRQMQSVYSKSARLRLTLKAFAILALFIMFAILGSLDMIAVLYSGFRCVGC